VLKAGDPGQTFEEMLDAIRDSLSDLSSSDDEEDGEDDEDTEQGKLSEHDEPGWVMGTISKMVQQSMEIFWQKQMKLDKLTEPERADPVDYIREKDMKYSTTELRVPAVVKPHTNDDPPNPSPTTFGELTQSHDIIPGISRIPQGTSRPGSGHLRLGFGRPQSNTRIS